MRPQTKHSERGVALLIVLFALLLLSAIGLGMMYSADSETSIAANFRDKQIAVNAAVSAVQEARDRIRPTGGDITAPAGIPSTSAANVIYIINPKSGETVAPWDYSNKYADPELCQENTLGLSGTSGVPCSGSASLPSGSAWYTTLNDSSSSYTGPFKLSTPMNYKWARIALKTDNMTPVSAVSSPSGAQVCWDGNHQIPLPTGYDPDCTPSGAVTITVTNPGSGYTSAPTIAIGPPPSGGTQATATASLAPTSNGQVNSVSVTSGGSGYSSLSPPTVSFSGGGGTGAAAVATVATGGAPVASVSVSSGTYCYASASTTVSLSGGGGSGAAATANMTGQTCIVGWTINGSTTCSKNATITVTASGGGSGFSGSFDTKGNGSYKSNAVITNPGSGYSGTPTFSVTGGGSCTTLSITPTLGYKVSSVSVTNGGSNYTSAPAVTIGTATLPTTPTATATLGTSSGTAGQVTAITVTSPGSGYTTAPTVTLTSATGSGATALASVGTTNGVNITMTNSGRKYTTVPSVTVTGGGGTGLTYTTSVSNGAYYGQVFLVTSLAQTTSGARALSQMEAATTRDNSGFSLGGAMTFAGPSPTFGAPNSNPFHVNGNDANSCGQTAINRPAIGVYDDPSNPTSPTAQGSTIAAIPRADHYTGSGSSTPDVENAYNSLGHSPQELEAFANAATTIATNTYSSNPSSIDLGNSTNASSHVVIVNGDLSLSGNNTGYGLLLVTGTLSMGGNFSWNGVILVIGKGVLNANGGGNGQINGAIYVAKTRDSSGNMLSSLGTPSVDWSGGGGNGVYYDHCLADNYLASVPYVPAVSTGPLKVLSIRTVSY